MEAAEVLKEITSPDPRLIRQLKKHLLNLRRLSLKKLLQKNKQRKKTEEQTKNAKFAKVLPEVQTKLLAQSQEKAPEV